MGDFYLFIYVRGSLYLHYTSLYPLRIVDAFCVLVFCLTKSAQLPFSAWLPKAMSAPTPTSALVHSSTLVTAGLVVLMTHVDVTTSRAVMNILLFIGLFTILAGRLAGLVETRVKKLIAYSTISQIGLRVMVIGLGDAKVGYILLIAHGFAKRLLFMQIGYLMHLCQNQNFRKWRFGGNLGAFINAQMAITLISLCGVGFSRGMLRKELILESGFYSGVNAILLLRVIVTLYLTFLYSAVIYKTLYGGAYSPFNNNQKSVVLIFLVGVEVWFVIIFFTWILKNIRIPTEISGIYYSERWWATGAFLVILTLSTSIINTRFIRKVFRHLNIRFGGLCPNVWVELFFIIAQQCEVWLYSVNAFLAQHV